MKRVIFSVMILCAASARPLWAQQNDIAVLRAEIAKQEVVIAQLLKRIEALEHQSPTPTAALQDLQDDIKAQDDSINSLRETVNSKVNLNGYYNFRFSADGSEEPASFQQHHLGVIMAKQLGKFNFLMELELQNVPHHAEIAVSGEGEEVHAEVEEPADTDLSVVRHVLQLELHQEAKLAELLRHDDAQVMLLKRRRLLGAVGGEPEIVVAIQVHLAIHRLAQRVD